MPRIPSSTYRFQVHSAFRLDDVRALLPYLDALGVGDVYLSPVTTAKAGSTHGYDVTDPTRINAEIGGDEAFETLAAAVRDRRMGLLVDIVPNHMAASTQNPWWLDVLEHGQNSPYARWFDIDWHPAALKGGLRGKLLVPVLGAPYGETLEAGQLRLTLEPEGLFVDYYETRLPLAPRTWSAALAGGLAALREAWGDGHEAVRRLADVLARAEVLPQRKDGERSDSEAMRSRAAVKRDFLDVLARHPDARERLAAQLAAEQGRPGEPGSFAVLDAILGAQHFWLVFWRLAGQEINFRRFFNITDLVALRAEDPAVFDGTHAFLLDLARKGRLTGLRIDHIDGLHDPAGYLRRLQQRLASAAPRGEAAAATAAAANGSAARRPAPFYVVVEKILGRDEPLPEGWACAGTTGYEFIDAINHLLVFPAGLSSLDALYRRHLGEDEQAHEVRYERKKAALARLFGGEARALRDQLGRLAALERHARDIPLAELGAALVEVTACLPVYRTYVRDGAITPRDAGYVEQALGEARRRADPDVIGEEAFRFLERVLLMRPLSGLSGLRRARLQFVLRWQQLTGPVMAKGLEDSTFYIYNPLVSLNEVGGEPELHDAEDGLLRFHRFCADRRRHWPGALNTTSTHDTKRSEDVRARIDVLTEIPEAWGEAFRRFDEIATPRRGRANGRPVPGPRMDFLLFETLLGAWPYDDEERAGFAERFAAYLLKAAREASLRTSWMRPDEEMERELVRFAGEILADGAFRAAFEELFERVAYAGAVNALVQALLKATAPGVPDVYQGCELWNFSLVDPDNRRPVDYARAARALREVEAGADDPARVEAWHRAYRDGRIKLHVLRAALRLRRERPRLFDAGAYVPLQVTGPRAAHVVAFARRHEEDWAVVAAARWVARLGATAPNQLAGECWGTTAVVLPEDAPARWTDRLSARAGVGPAEGRVSLPVARLFATLPLCLLTPGDVEGDGA